MFKRIVALIVAMAFISTGIVPPALAQGVLLPLAGNIVTLSPSVQPFLLKGMKVDARDPLRMEFLFDEGSQSMINDDFNAESLRLIKYFLASLTIPNKDLWVNLSPYESQRIVQEDLGRTGMGRDLLAQDYILKQLTAGLLHPDGATGKAFWAEIYRRSFEMFGTTDIPIDTFNKVWIVPGKSVVYQARSPDGTKMSAFVEKLELKVMLESDYLARAAVQENAVVDNAAVAMAKDVLREVVIPVLEKEVNEGSNFAQLRQVCHSLILSSWFKKKLLASAERAAVGETGGNAFAQVFVDQHKTAGVEIDNARVETSRIYDRYVEAFKKGAYNLIKEEVDVYSEELIPRKYFSGGFTAEEADKAMIVIDGTPDMAQGNFKTVTTDLAMQTKDAAQKIRPWVIKAVFKATALIILLQLFRTASFERMERPLAFSDVNEEMEMEDPEEVPSTSEIVKRLAHNRHEYVSGVVGRDDIAKISPTTFLANVLGHKIRPGLTDQEKEIWQMDMSIEFEEIISSSIKDLHLDFSSVELSNEAMTQLVLGIIMQETEGVKSMQVAADGTILARGKLSTEYTTWLKQLKIAEDWLKKFPGTSEDLLKKIQKARKDKKLGSIKKNHWFKGASLVDSFKDYIKIELIYLHHMLDYEPMSVRVILNRADKQLSARFALTVPDEIKSDLERRIPSLRELIKIIEDEGEYEDLGTQKVAMALLIAGWNRGFNNDEHVWRYILSHINSSQEEMEESLLDAQKILRKFESKMEEAKESLKRARPQNREALDRIFKTTNGRLDGLVALFRKVPKEERAGFWKKWCAFRTVEKKYKGKQREILSKNAVLYLKNVFATLDIGDDDPNQLGKDFPDTRRKIRSALIPLGKSLAEGQGDNAQSSYGGIDLTDENIAEVRGEAGLFGFDLTPDQVVMLKENVNGFLPIIVNVQAVTDVKAFLGVR